jgi:NAD(P)-dependent dehydrogenase (short-subunit alcohol dehydrogenase family)
MLWGKEKAGYMIKAVGISRLFDLKGKTAVVTGGSGAICGSLAEQLALNGVKVAVLDLNPEKAEAAASEVRKAGGVIKVFACSVLDEQQLQEVSRQILDAFGPPHFLLSGAGGNHPSGSTAQKYAKVPDDASVADPFEDFFTLDLAGFQKVMDLNFNGTLLPSKVFGKIMAGEGRGVIVNISSMSGIVPLTRVPAYSAAKAAVINLTRWMAVHLSRTGIRVNTIAPGFIATEQSRFLQFDPVTGELNERGREIIRHTPFQRFGEPEEIFGTLVWLLSEASRFVTGAVIPVDGGFSAAAI